MKQVSPSAGIGVLNYAVKVVLSVAAIVALLAALNLVFRVHRMLQDSESGVQNLPPLYVGKPAAAHASDAPVQTLWPEFPHNNGGTVQSSVINGIQVIAEEWDCGASPDDILSYYRDQMTARGWQDTTKQAYNLQPEMNEMPGDTEKEQYISNYRDVTDSTLVFNRGDWSLRISTEPAKEGFHQTSVRFYAAKTPSIVDVGEVAMASVVPKQGQKESPLDVIQKSDGDNYHTMISTKLEPSKDAFRDALADVTGKGWRPVLFKRLPQGYFAWLVKGQQYGALSVRDEHQGQSSSVTLIEVTPK